MNDPLKDPLDISTDPELIKDAQKAVTASDVLVCGGCHEVYHFVEEFQEHKNSNTCAGKSVLRCENEEKIQIWGFTLWKTKRAREKKEAGEELPSSWEVYQTWTKLEQSEKDLWITAGKTLQYCNKIGTAKVKEVPKEKDPLALDDAAENGGKKRGVRTMNDNEKVEYNVEKIVGKRFNHRKRLWEYEVKWENYSDETWEPLSHLENCKALVQEYEDRVKAEKEKEKAATPSRGRGRPRVGPGGSSGVTRTVEKKVAPPVTPVLLTTAGGRPQRSSKQKALNQVKAWCGNISDGDEPSGKRLFDDGDSDDSFERKIKLEGVSDDSDDEELKMPPKKIQKIVHSSYNNGAGRKLPDNVLIPDAKGIVRISQKQLPSLSSGVYIMSKSSGIIKLDPTASKIATSGGQAIVKVSPKVGQTQIRIIKKDDGTKRMVQVKGPDALKTTPSTTKVVHHLVTKQPLLKKEVEKPAKKLEPPLKVEAAPKVQPPKKEEETKPKIDDDSDDGIEELEFPTDLPLPGPDSPPGDFILDPFTGKVAGQEYPDPEPEPKIEPKSEPQQQAADESSKSDKTQTETIDNIVKLAAADITEEDLKPQVTAAPSTAPAVKTPTPSPAKTVVSVATAAPPKSHPQMYAVVTEVKPKQSILNKAIANSNILQKTLQTPRPKPRIINQSMPKPRPQVVRTSLGTPSPKPIVRQKIAPGVPKPRINMVQQGTANVYTKTNNITPKVAPVYKPKPATPVVKKTPPVVRAAPVAVTPKAVINMPSLDPEPAVEATAAAAATVEADLSTFTLATGDRPMFITADDGTVYQVAGQNEEGQTILVTQDSDGQQQCLLVTGEAIQEEVEQVEAPAQVLMEVQEPAEAAEEQPLVAQFIRTEPPSPGGTHKVVVMLPDGDMMVTQVTPEEYASLELDK